LGFQQRVKRHQDHQGTAAPHATFHNVARQAPDNLEEFMPVNNINDVDKIQLVKLLVHLWIVARAVFGPIIHRVSRR
jgi:hypothetical protein